MRVVKADIERQLRRQSTWLRDSWIWLFKTKILQDQDDEGRRPTALDVGCGPGFVMETLTGLLDVRGVDFDKDMVNACRSRGLDADRANVYELPFQDSAFDIVYCSFLLLWLANQQAALEEMKRVSKKWIVCLAEPDFGGRIDHPPELSYIKELIIEGVEKGKGDPFIGRRLRGLFKDAGMESEIGVHTGVWGIDRLKVESEDEWLYFESIVKSEKNRDRLKELRRIWERALVAGTLFQFNPIFYAIAQK